MTLERPPRNWWPFFVANVCFFVPLCYFLGHPLLPFSQKGFMVFYNIHTASCVKKAEGNQIQVCSGPAFYLL